MTARSLVVTTLLVASGVAHAGSVRVQNNDSSKHTVEVRCSGTKKTVEIKASTTATYSFHSTATECEIVGGSIEFPTETIENGQKWRISKGKAAAL